ncbi:MAG: VOC family protein [Dehalococcoidia bacterium]|nr:VOC family protein [Dehalococcoidia bacterium]
MISEIKFVTQGVERLERAVRFYQEAFGFVEHGRMHITGPAFEAAWRMPAGLRGDAVILGLPDRHSGLLRLVQFDRPGERIWGSYERLHDLGHYAVNYRYRDIKSGWQRLLAAGAAPKSAPLFWKVNEDIQAWDAQAYDPDGVLLDVFEVMGNLEGTLGWQETEASEVQSVAIHVADEAWMRRFLEGLGFRVLFDVILEGMGHFLGTAEDIRVHNVNFISPHAPNGRIEFSRYLGTDGQPLTERAVPPNIGILSISLETDDLETTRALVTSLGATPIAGPFDAVMPPFGRVRFATFHGRDGEQWEFFERLS